MRTELSKKIEKLCSVSKVTSDPKQVFDHLMVMGFNLLNHGALNLVCKTFNVLECNQDTVIELSMYKKDLRAWELLQECFTAYMHEIRQSEPFDDVIGLQYDEYLGKVLGQFLTPKDIADALVYINMMGSLEEHIKNKEHFDIQDMCVGAGALPLGALRAILKEFGEEGLRYSHLFLNDIDLNMVRMSAVQIIFPAIMHSKRIGSVHITNFNAITQYEEMCCVKNPSIIAIGNMFDFDLYKKRKYFVE